MHALGTILPTRETMRLADKFHADMIRLKRETATRHGLDKLETRQEQGETRYYDGHNSYAIASKRPGVVLWFDRMNDGYFYARR